MKLFKTFFILGICLVAHRALASDFTCARVTKALSAYEPTYFSVRLPESNGYRFNKKQLTILFNFRDRAVNDPQHMAKIESDEENRTIGLIFDKTVSPKKSFSLQEINEELLLGAFHRLASLRARMFVDLHPYLQYDDVLQSCMIGLHKAILEYDSKSSFMFSTVAFNIMRGEVQPLFSIDVSPWDLEIKSDGYNSVVRIKEALYSRLGREPSAEEITEAFNEKYKAPIQISAVRKVLKKMSIANRTVTHFINQGKWDTMDSDDAIHELIDANNLLKDDITLIPEEAAFGRDLNEKLVHALLTIRPDYRRILQMRFGFAIIKRGPDQWELVQETDGMTLEEVGQAEGVTRERIRQIEGKTLRMLKHPSRTDSIRIYHEG